MGWQLGISMDGRTLPSLVTAHVPFLDEGRSYRFSFTLGASGEPLPMLLATYELGQINGIMLLSSGGTFYAITLYVRGSAARTIFANFSVGQTLSLLVEPSSGKITLSGATSGNGAYAFDPWVWGNSWSELGVGGAYNPPFSNTFTGSMSNIEYLADDKVVEPEVVEPPSYAEPRSGLFVNGDLEEEEEMAPRTAMLPFGLCTHWNEAEQHFSKWKEAGVQWLRFDIPWDELEGVQGTFLWSRWDTALAIANSLDLKVLLVLGYTPTWANGGNPHNYSQLVGFDSALQNMVRLVTDRYASMVSAWEMWNEPDLDVFHHAHAGDWAYTNYGGESTEIKNRIQYKHTVDIAMQAGLAGKYLTTSGFAEAPPGAGMDSGMRNWCAERRGWFDQFSVASFHCYGWQAGSPPPAAGYDRLQNIPNDYRGVQDDGGFAWPGGFWITEHGITSGVNADVDDKTFLIRSYALALSQERVQKLYWFRGGFDPGHRDMLTNSSVRTAVFYGYKLLATFWATVSSVARWASGNAQGAVGTMVDGSQVAVVWQHGDTGSSMPISSLGFSIDRVYDQDGTQIATSTMLTARPVFIFLV